MPPDLHDLVEKELVPRVAQTGLRVVSHEKSDTFDNAFVLLEAGDVRVRVIRERGQVFADFGSTAEPSVWFDSAVVMEYLQLSESAGFHDKDARRAIVGLSKFINALWGDLKSQFERRAFSKTKQQLIAVREARDERRFGPRNP